MSPISTRGFTAVMARRREPPDAFDYFPTPLWSTRALFLHVLPAIGIDVIGTVWEPARGEGRATAVFYASFRDNLAEVARIWTATGVIGPQASPPDVPVHKLRNATLPISR
jgi:hypothetical protein